jgi:hypothetical protein
MRLRRGQLGRRREREGRRTNGVHDRELLQVRSGKGDFAQNVSGTSSSGTVLLKVVTESREGWSEISWRSREGGRDSECAPHQKMPASSCSHIVPLSSWLRVCRERSERSNESRRRANGMRRTLRREPGGARTGEATARWSHERR